MNTYLLYKDKNYKEDPNKYDHYSDLWFTTIINHMCVYDRYIKDIYLDAYNIKTNDVSIIKYREDILKDFIKNKNVMLNYYSFITDLITSINEDRYEIKSNEVTKSFNSSLRVSPKILIALENMTRYFKEYRELFKSEGMLNFIDRYLSAFPLDYIKELKDTIDLLKFPKGIYVVANLDNNLNPSNYKIYKTVLDKAEIKKDLKPTGIALRNKISMFSDYEYTIKENSKWKKAKVIENPRAQANSETEFLFQTNEALLSIAPMFINVIDDIYRYLVQTKKEMAFYIGGINLYDKLMTLNLPICNPICKSEPEFKCTELYDLALALENGGKVVGNTLEQKGHNITFITGANQGGKTTFLRSYGQAILMMQLGLFVCASHFESNTFLDIYTHFNKEEDKTMTSGKLDEELKRLRGIIDVIKPGSLMLFNESFQSTSEVEGAIIAYDVIRALHESNISVVMVSHMYHLYKLLNENLDNDVYYLRALRDDAGKRSYKLIESRPLETSFAIDLYNEIFKGE